MRYLTPVLSVFAAALTYALVGFIAGPKGIIPMRALISERNRVSANVSALREVNDDLQCVLDNLSADPDTISVYAHELGYVREGERLIKLAGFTGGIDRKLFPGTALKVVPPSYLPEWLCKITGIIFGILTYSLIAYRKRRAT